MTLQAFFVLVVLLVAAVLFATEKLRPDLIALLVLLAFGVSGILTAREALAGFSSSAVITIIGVFILTEALEKTGVTQTLGTALVRLGGVTEGGLMLALMLGGALLSLFMNNIAAGAVLLPVAVGIARQQKISPSHLMMPLAFGTLLGGTATLLTSNNILANATLRANDLPGFTLLTFAPFGIPAILVGTAYMYFFGRKLLPHRAPADWTRMLQAGRGQLADIYGLRERWFQARVPDASPILNKSLAELGLGTAFGVNVVAVENNAHIRLAPSPATRLHAGDSLFLQAREEQIDSLRSQGLDLAAASLSMGELRDEEMGLFEVVLAPRSQALGKTLRDVHFRDKYGLSVIAIWREGHPRRVGVGDMKLQQGDALLVLGPRRRAELLQSESDFIVLTETDETGPRRSKAKWVVPIMAAALLAGASGIVSIAESMLAGALGVVLVGALNMEEAYQAIEWRVIFLIAGMLSAGVAMTKTGAAEFLANQFVGLFGNYGHLVVLLVLMVVTVALVQVMTGQATIALTAPIAYTTAQVIHADPNAFVLGVALASSLAFISPLGHPVNLLVMGPGGYKFKDYARVGILLTILLLALFALLFAFVYPV